MDPPFPGLLFLSAFCNMRVGNFGHGTQNEITSNRTNLINVTPLSTFTLASPASPQRVVKCLESVLFTAYFFSLLRIGCSKAISSGPLRDKVPSFSSCTLCSSENAEDASRQHTVWCHVEALHPAMHVVCPAAKDEKENKTSNVGWPFARWRQPLPCQSSSFASYPKSTLKPYPRGGARQRLGIHWEQRE